MEQTILTIYNRHTEACGPPPAVSNESPDVYVGYFENRYGEQWIFTYDRRTRTAMLRGGDTHWAAGAGATRASPLLPGRLLPTPSPWHPWGLPDSILGRRCVDLAWH